MANDLFIHDENTLIILGYDFSDWTTEQFECFCNDCGWHCWDDEGNEFWYEGNSPEEFAQFVIEGCGFDRYDMADEADEFINEWRKYGRCPIATSK